MYIIKKNILLIGGSGALGTALQKYNKFKNIKLFIINSNQCNTNNFISNKVILSLITQLNINYIIDFTRNTKKQLNNALILLKYIPYNIHYIHISTYGIEYPEIYPNEFEYNFVKKTLEENLRLNDYSIRLPVIINNYKDIIWNDISTNYIFIATFKYFAKFIFDIILNKKPGKFKMYAKKIFKKIKNV